MLSSSPPIELHNMKKWPWHFFHDRWSTIPAASLTSLIRTCFSSWDAKCDCIIQLKLCGMPLRSILVNIVSLFWVSGNGWPVLESIKLRIVCDTYIRTQTFRTIYRNIKFEFKKGILPTWTTSWLHHRIAWCSIDNHTFFMPVLLIIKPLVGGTIPSRDSNFVLT